MCLLLKRIHIVYLTIKRNNYLVNTNFKKKEINFNQNKFDN